MQVMFTSKHFRLQKPFTINIKHSGMSSEELTRMEVDILIKWNAESIVARRATNDIKYCNLIGGLKSDDISINSIMII